MRDPKPGNIKGEKHVSHTVNHSVDWGHVALGVGLLALAYVLASAWDGESDEDDDSVV